MKRIATFVLLTFWLAGLAPSPQAQTVEERVTTLEASERTLRETLNALGGDVTRLREELNNRVTADVGTLRQALDQQRGEATAASTRLRTDMQSGLQGLSGDLSKFAAVSVPVGTVVAYAGPVNTIPSNWRLCNGDPLSRDDFRELFRAIGTTWGGDGAPTFRLPDLRGMFLRGVDGGAGIDPDTTRRLASRQADMMQNHKHSDRGHGHSATTTGNVPNIPSSFGEEVEGGDGALANGNEGNQGSFSPGISASTTIGTGNADITDPVASDAGAPRVGRETRPVNVAVFWIIKVKDTGAFSVESSSQPAPSPSTPQQ